MSATVGARGGQQERLQHDIIPASQSNSPGINPHLHKLKNTVDIVQQWMQLFKH